MSVNIIEHIWNGTIELHEGWDLSPLASILCSLLAAPTICFTIDVGEADVEPFATHAGDEVLLGASLADVLFEEIGIEISDETIVFFEPSAQIGANSPSSVELGLALGNVLVSLARTKETEALENFDKKKPVLAPHTIKRRMQVELVQ